MPDLVLELINLTKTYQVSAGAFRGQRDLRAVNGITLTLEKGEVLGLVGESGCGKTTVAKLVLALETPTSGHIRLQGRPLAECDSKEIARQVQPVFQDPYASLNPRKSVGSIISLPLRALRVGNRASWNKKVSEIMEVVGLAPHMRHNYPNQLSGGQRQRVAVARALIMRPQLVLCDEPTSALDVSVQAQILNLLKKLQEEFSLTYLFVTHHLLVVKYISNRIAVMYLGKIVELGPTAEIFGHPLHPYTRALLSAIPIPDPETKREKIILTGDVPNPINPPSGCRFHPRCAHAREICHTVEPLLQDAGGGRTVACHRWREI